MYIPSTHNLQTQTPLFKPLPPESAARLNNMLSTEVHLHINDRVVTVTIQFMLENLPYHLGRVRLVGSKLLEILGPEWFSHTLDISPNSKRDIDFQFLSDKPALYVANEYLRALGNTLQLNEPEITLAIKDRPFKTFETRLEIIDSNRGEERHLITYKGDECSFDIYFSRSIPEPCLDIEALGMDLSSHQVEGHIAIQGILEKKVRPVSLKKNTWWRLICKQADGYQAAERLPQEYYVNFDLEHGYFHLHKALKTKYKDSPEHSALLVIAAIADLFAQTIDPGPFLELVKEVVPPAAPKWFAAKYRDVPLIELLAIDALLPQHHSEKIFKNMHWNNPLQIPQALAILQLSPIRIVGLEELLMGTPKLNLKCVRRFFRIIYFLKEVNPDLTPKLKLLIHSRVQKMMEKEQFESVKILFNFLIGTPFEINANALYGAPEEKILSESLPTPQPIPPSPLEHALDLYERLENPKAKDELMDFFVKNDLVPFFSSIKTDPFYRAKISARMPFYVEILNLLLIQENPERFFRVADNLSYLNEGLPGKLIQELFEGRKAFLEAHAEKIAILFLAAKADYLFTQETAAYLLHCLLKKIPSIKTEELAAGFIARGAKIELEPIAHLLDKISHPALKLQIWLQLRKRLFPFISRCDYDTFFNHSYYKLAYHLLDELDTVEPMRKTIESTLQAMLSINFKNLKAFSFFCTKSFIDEYYALLKAWLKLPMRNKTGILNLFCQFSTFHLPIPIFNESISMKKREAVDCPIHHRIAGSKNKQLFLSGLRLVIEQEDEKIYTSDAFCAVFLEYLNHMERLFGPNSEEIREVMSGIAYRVTGKFQQLCPANAAKIASKWTKISTVNTLYDQEDKYLLLYMKRIAGEIKEEERSELFLTSLYLFATTLKKPFKQLMAMLTLYMLVSTIITYKDSE